jgi:hypothetical protein
MRDRFPRDLFWAAAVPFLFGLLLLAIGWILFRVWNAGGFPLLVVGGVFALLAIVVTVLIRRRHCRSSHLRSGT